MKYNPITKELYTDSGSFLKKLHCPLSKQWQELSPTLDLKVKECDHCQSTVYDTSLLTDDDIQNLLSVDSSTCLKVNINQSNLTITYQTNEQQ